MSKNYNLTLRVARRESGDDSLRYQSYEITAGPIMRFVDLMLCFPTFFLILAVIAFLDPSIWNIMVIIGLTGWMGVARLVRAEFLSLRERDRLVERGDESFGRLEGGRISGRLRLRGPGEGAKRKRKRYRACFCHPETPDSIL